MELDSRLSARDLVHLTAKPNSTKVDSLIRESDFTQNFHNMYKNPIGLWTMTKDKVVFSATTWLYVCQSSIYSEALRVNRNNMVKSIKILNEQIFNSFKFKLYGDGGRLSVNFKLKIGSGRTRKLRNVTYLINLLGKGFNYSVTQDGRLLLNSTCRTFAVINRQRRPVKLFGREFLTTLGTLTSNLVWGNRTNINTGRSKDLLLFVVLERLGIVYRELLGFGSLRFTASSKYILQDLDLLVCVLRKLSILDSLLYSEKTRSFFTEILNSRNVGNINFIPNLTLSFTGSNSQGRINSNVGICEEQGLGVSDVGSFLKTVDLWWVKILELTLKMDESGTGVWFCEEAEAKQSMPLSNIDGMGGGGSDTPNPSNMEIDPSDIFESGKTLSDCECNNYQILQRVTSGGEVDTILSMAFAIDDYIQDQRNKNTTYLSKFATQILNKPLDSRISIYSKTLRDLNRRRIGPKKTFAEV